MVVSKAKRVDPRALLAMTSSSANSQTSSLARKKATRFIAVTSAAVIIASAFGAIVVQANDDNSAIMFMRQNTRPVTRSAPAPVYRQAPPTQYYYAPQAFYPRSQAPVARPSVATSYAPFVGFFPSENARAPRRKTAETRAPAKQQNLTLTVPSRSSELSIGERQAYCVRTCDGFFFPLSTSAGSDKADELACNNLCPTSETKLYIGTRGADIDNARSRDNGRVYASVSNAFSYRKAVDKSCSCSVNGFGLSTNTNVLRDGTLRVGDIVMTKTGMKIFSGGSFPYRDGNFDSIGGSGLISASTRESLRKVEQASLPGRSGLANTPLPKANTNNEARELKSATAVGERADFRGGSTAMRYIGPDRPIVAR